MTLCFRSCYLLRTLYLTAIERRNLSKIAPSVCIFDRNLKRKQRDRSAQIASPETFDYLRDECGYNTADRILDIKREFNLLLDLGCGRGYISQHLTNDVVKSIVQCDLSRLWVEQSVISSEVPTMKVVTDEEILPFCHNTFDIVVSSLNLHWVNNLPKCFQNILDILVKDGPFIGSMFYGDSLFELRSSLQMAELEVEGGCGPHVSPFTSPPDIGSLLQNIGYTLITLDCDEVIIHYPSIMELMHDLRGMAENNCTFKRKNSLRRETVKVANEYYKKEYGRSDGSIPATFQILNFIAWKSHPDQKPPSKRGSGTVSMKDIGRLDSILKSSQLSDSDKTLNELQQFSDSLDKNKT